MKSIKENIFVYENNLKFNYKKYYIGILGGINEKLKNILDINIIDLKESSNFIIYEYEITKDKLNEPIRILNSYEDAKKQYSWIEGISNEKEIKENCEVYLNNNKINFCYIYNFQREEKHTIQILFHKYLTNTNFMFCDCRYMVNLNLSNFKVINVINMSRMFYKCSSLIYLNLSNFNTKIQLI